MMSDVFTMLERDHRHVEALLDALAGSEVGRDRERLLAALRASLQLHMQFEEREIYPLLARIDDTLEDEAEVEHGLAREGLARLTELVTAPGFGAVVDMVQAGISHHVEDEEQQAFPRLRQAIDGATADGLAESLMKDRAAAGTLGDDLQSATKDDLLDMAQDAEIEGRSSMSKNQLVDALTKVASS